ncbi:hypothetical protein K439DRAFT_1157867 [Ramaria rubella]|nr:hypothetical protein K439DRAFT_1157867 [Ramaria rubella]
MHPDSSPSSDPADPEHSITSPSVNLASSVTNLPIPAFAQGWDASITRPSSLPERYDTRIPVESIFYLPLKNIHVVAQRCDHCAKLQQACNRALPACGRCAQIGKPCRVSNAGYVNLPGPRQSRQLGGAGKGGSRSTSTVASSSKEKRPRMSSEAVRLKRQNVAVAVASEGRQKRKYTVEREREREVSPSLPKKA